jgi:hypothetical protein
MVICTGSVSLACVLTPPTVRTRGIPAPCGPLAGPKDIYLDVYPDFCVPGLYRSCKQLRKTLQDDIEEQ